MAAASPLDAVSARATTENALRSVPRHPSVVLLDSTTPSARRVTGDVTPARVTASASQTSTASERDAAYAGMDRRSP
jgi:hypothetical protein